jgi:chemotaxis protein MotB
MRRRRKHEEHQNHEAWAIPYGDLVTLLLAFFVVMYAISQVNAGKYRVLSDSMVAAFRGSPAAVDPVQVGEQEGGPPAELRITGSPSLPIHPEVRRLAGSLTDPDVKRVAAIQPVPLPALGAEPVPNPATSAMNRVADAVETAMQDLVASKTVVVRRHDLWVEVELRTDVLFPSGAAQLAPGAIGVIEKLAGALAAFPNPIRVEGYTDNRPINTVQYPSNWELSAARAATVVGVLARHGVDPTRLSVLGLGEFRPVTSNATPEGRNANRRVLLVIQNPGDPATDATATATPPAATATALDTTPVATATATAAATADPAASKPPGRAAAPPAAGTDQGVGPATPSRGPAAPENRPNAAVTRVPQAAAVSGRPALQASVAATGPLTAEQH